MDPENLTCFVIGPIGNALAPQGSTARQTYEDAVEVLEQVIVPACQSVGLRPVRADEIAVSGEITEQVYRHLRDDDVVIADLTGANPNVMYELGIRHTVDKLTIPIGEFDTLPFDVQSIRTVQFSRSRSGLVQARKRLEEALAVGLADNGDPVTVTRLWSSREVTVIQEESSTAEDAEEELPGVFESIASIDTRLKTLTAVTSDITADVKGLGEAAESLQPEMDVLNKRSATASARLAFIERFADRLTKPAQALDAHSESFKQELDGLNSDVNSVLDFWEGNVGLASEQTSSFLDSLVVLAESSRQGMGGLAGLVPTLQPFRQLSRTLRSPIDQIIRAVQRLVQSVEVIDSWGSRAQRLAGAIDNVADVPEA